MVELNRRQVLKLGLAGTAALGATALGFDLTQAILVKQNLRITGAKESHSVCPYCAVGCSILAYTRDNPDGTQQLLQIEGDPDSPINVGRLCPKGATAMQLAVAARRLDKPMYRAPKSDKWQEITWDDLLNKLAQNIKASRDATFVATDSNGVPVNRTEGVAFAGGAAFSSEEGYVATKLMRGLGLIHLEQQARV